MEAGEVGGGGGGGEEEHGEGLVDCEFFGSHSLGGVCAWMRAADC